MVLYDSSKNRAAGDSGWRRWGGRDGWDEVPWACLVMNYALVNLLSIFGDLINVFEKKKVSSCISHYSLTCYSIEME